MMATKPKKLAIVFDFETTGFIKHASTSDHHQPRIIEAGALLIDKNGTTVDAFSQLVNPRVLIPAEITKITGIQNDDVIDAPSFGEIWPALRAFFDRAGMAFAHNLNFDKSILEIELRRLDVTDFEFPPICVCTMQASSAMNRGKRLSLKNLYAKVIGTPLAQTHRALDDAAAVAAILKAKRDVYLGSLA